MAPTTIRGFAMAVTNQINFFGPAYGGRHREERIEALRFLLRIHEDTPDLPTVEFISVVWEQANCDFFTKCQEGATRLGQTVGQHASKIELRRVGFQLGPAGKARRIYPRTFDMTTEAGYWSRVVAPKMDEAIEKEGFSTARDRVLGKPPRRTNMEVENPKVKANAVGMGNAWKEWREWGDAGKTVGGQPGKKERKEGDNRMYLAGGETEQDRKKCSHS